MSFSWYKSIKHILTALVICIIDVSCFTPRASAQVSKGEITESGWITFVDSCHDTLVWFHGHYVNSYLGVDLEYWGPDTGNVTYILHIDGYPLRVSFSTNDIDTLDLIAHELRSLLPSGTYLMVADYMDYCTVGAGRLVIR